MSTPSTAEILDSLAASIRTVIGEDWAQDVEIDMDTRFDEDLELESIEFVALAETVRERWGDRVDFAGWLAGKEIDAIIQLKVGDVVAFVEESLSAL